jgi:hypothetical protein
MVATGIEQARNLTFTGQGGKLVQAVNLVKTQRGWRYPMTFLFPFVKTPIQVLGTGLRKSPLGSLRMLKKGATGEYRGDAGRAAMVKDGAEQVVAQALTWIALGLVTRRDEEGRRYVTGNRVPTLNPGERGMRQANEPAQSIRIGGTWYSYARLDPFARGALPTQPAPGMGVLAEHALLHGNWHLLAYGALALGVLAWRVPGVSLAATAMLVLLAAQVTIGILNVVWLLPLWLATLHNVGAALLLCSVVMLKFMLTRPAAADVRTPASKGSTQALHA